MKTATQTLGIIADDLYHEPEDEPEELIQQFIPTEPQPQITTAIPPPPPFNHRFDEPGNATNTFANINAILNGAA